MLTGFLSLVRRHCESPSPTLTDSTTPNGSPFDTDVPTCDSSTNTMSPSWAWTRTHGAKCVSRGHHETRCDQLLAASGPRRRCPPHPPARVRISPLWRSSHPPAPIHVTRRTSSRPLRRRTAGRPVSNAHPMNSTGGPERRRKQRKTGPGARRTHRQSRVLAHVAMAQVAREAPQRLPNSLTRQDAR